MTGERFSGWHKDFTPLDELPLALQWIENDAPALTPESAREILIEGGNCLTADGGLRAKVVTEALSAGPLKCPNNQRGDCPFTLLTTESFTGHCAILGPDAREPEENPATQAYVSLDRTEGQWRDGDNS